MMETQLNPHNYLESYKDEALGIDSILACYKNNSFGNLYENFESCADFHNDLFQSNLCSVNGLDFTNTEEATKECPQENSTPKTLVTPANENISKYIPQWKEIFPWLAWSSNEQVLYCLHCRKVLKHYIPNQIAKGNIGGSMEIFSVSQILRKHQDSIAHSSCIFISLYSNLKLFIGLTMERYKELKQEACVIEILRNIFRYNKLEKKSFEVTVKELAKYIEIFLLYSLRKSKYFSVVADQCRGIIILRWMSIKGQWQEHVLWSYVSVWDKSPIAYLRSLDIDYDKKCTIYIANSLCQQCKRCENTKVDLGALPPRPPSLLSFISLLWDLDFLKPLSSLVNSVLKIWKVYPFKFSSSFDAQQVKGLANYQSKPGLLIPLLQNISAIKKIGLEVYKTGYHIEALGLAMINIEKDEKHAKILTTLQEIIAIANDITRATKISEQQIVALSQAFNSLKIWSSGVSFVKDSISNEHMFSSPQRNEKLWEFLHFVEKFIEENQKSIYYTGRDKIQSFCLLCSTSCVIDPQTNCVNEAKLKKHFDLVYSLANLSNAGTKNLGEKERTYLSVKSYHNQMISDKLKVKTIMDVIHSFNENSHFKTRFPEAYELFQFCASMPFLVSDANVSLFVSFVIEQRVESSIWTSSDKDMKHSLLYLQHELPRIPHEAVLKWWSNCKFS